MSSHSYGETWARLHILAIDTPMPIPILIAITIVIFKL